MKRVLLAAMLLAVAMVSLARAADQVQANGVPRLVKLSYISGFSNWGPTDAEGVLEFSFAEAYVRVDVKRLPPQGGHVYEGWLVNPEGAAFLVGVIPVDSAGLGVLETKLTALPRNDYNLFIIAGRATDTPSGAVPEKFSIAGRFESAAGSATKLPGDVRPAALPDTGERPAPGLFDRVLRTVAVMVLAAVIAGGSARLFRRKGSPS